MAGSTRSLQMPTPGYVDDTSFTKLHEAARRGVVDGIGKWVLFHRASGNLFAVGSRELDSYLIVPEAKVELVMHIIGYLDGMHDIGWIQDKVAHEIGKKANVNELVRQLESAGLIKSTGIKTRPYAETLRNSIHLFSVPVESFYKSLRLFSVLFSPWALLAGLIGLIIGYIAVLHGSSLLVPQTIRTLSRDGILVVAGTLLIALLHEASHGIAGIRFGLSPTRPGMKTRD